MKKIYSELYGEEIILKFEKHDKPQLNCSRCGRLLKSFYVIQGCKTGIEHAYIGKECIKHL